MFKKIIAISLLTMGFNTLHAAQICQDDPRLYTIKTVIEDINAGKDVAPIKLTGATFLALTTPVRKALGDNITVQDENCVPYQVFNGAPAKKIALPFEQLATELEKAAIRKDKQAFDIVLDFFEAKPKDTQSLIALLTPLPWSGTAAGWAQEMGLLTISAQESFATLSLSHIKEAGCHDLKATNTNIELFSKLGGRLQEDGIVVSASEGDNNVYLTATDGSFYVSRDYSTRNPKTGSTCSNIQADVAIGALASTGVRIISNPESSGSRRNSESTQRKWLKEQFPIQTCGKSNCESN